MFSCPIPSGYTDVLSRDRISVSLSLSISLSLTHCVYVVVSKVVLCNVRACVHACVCLHVFAYVCLRVFACVCVRACARVCLCMRILFH